MNGAILRKCLPKMCTILPQKGIKLVLIFSQYYLYRFVMLISRSWMKESTPILFHMKVMVMDITLKRLGVPDLHLRTQERPPKSGSVPDGCQIYIF